MESRQARNSKIHVFVLVGLVLLSSIERISSLSVTVNDDECVQEYALYEGDTVSGNFAVVVDHGIRSSRFGFHANESTRKRVIFYTVGEYMFLAGASGLQVLYIRKLFSMSVAYNRV